MSRQVYTEGVSRLWACSKLVCSGLPFLRPHRRSQRTIWQSLSASEPWAVTVRQKYLQGLGTWRRSHVVQGYRALGEGASRKPESVLKSTIDLFVEYW